MTVAPLLLAAALAAVPAHAQSGRTRVGDAKYDGQVNTVEYKTDAKNVVAAGSFKAVQWIIKKALPPTEDFPYLRMMLDQPEKIGGGMERRMGYEMIGDALRVLVEDRGRDDPYKGFPHLKEPWRGAVKKHVEELLANKAYSPYFQRILKEHPEMRGDHTGIAYWEIASNMVVYTPESTKSGADKDTGLVKAEKYMLLPFSGGSVDFKREPPPADGSAPAKTPGGRQGGAEGAPGVGGGLREHKLGEQGAGPEYMIEYSKTSAGQTIGAVWVKHGREYHRTRVQVRLDANGTWQYDSGANTRSMSRGIETGAEGRDPDTKAMEVFTVHGVKEQLRLWPGSLGLFNGDIASLGKWRDKD